MIHIVRKILSVIFVAAIICLLMYRHITINSLAEFTSGFCSAFAPTIYMLGLNTSEYFSWINTKFISLCGFIGFIGFMCGLILEFSMWYGLYYIISRITKWIKRIVKNTISWW